MSRMLWLWVRLKRSELLQLAVRQLCAGESCASLPTSVLAGRQLSLA